MRNLNRPNNHPATPGKAGGWIHRMALVKGSDVCRDKINIPQNYDLYEKIKEVISVTASKDIKMGTLELYDARLDVYNSNGKDLLITIGCTQAQSSFFV